MNNLNFKAVDDSQQYSPHTNRNNDTPDAKPAALNKHQTQPLTATATPTSAILTMPNGNSYALPMIHPSQGPLAVDGSHLIKAGVAVYCPSLNSIATCQSSITFVDGQAGRLTHRGYSIESLAEQANFLSLTHLLLFKSLPNAQQTVELQQRLQEKMTLPATLFDTLQGMPKSAHPMIKMRALLAALEAVNNEKTKAPESTNEQRTEALLSIIAALPVLTAACYRHEIGKPINTPLNNAGFAEQFLHLMFSDSDKLFSQAAALTKALDTIFLLHADHEQNASTSVVRSIESTLASPYASISGGLEALSGPSHGGANEAVIKMLNEIGDVSKIDHYIARAKNKADPFLLPGFGHRLYQIKDPRASIMQSLCEPILDIIGHHHNPRFELAKALELKVLADPYFQERNLYPNVDYYSGIILDAMGIPSQYFTPLFAIARSSGWSAHFQEMAEQGFHIKRPRQIYTGPVDIKVDS